MGISIIILCLLLQRFFSINYGVYQLPIYFMNYYHLLTQKMKVSVVLLILPMVVIITLLFAGVYHFTGAVGYYLLSAILFWMAVDCRKDLVNESTAVIDELFIAVYNRFFAPTFWYVILGPAGLVLYTAVASLLVYLTTQSESRLLRHTVKLKGYLDWIPLRVVGFGFAVMGNFSVAFKNWLVSFRHPFALNEEIIAQFGLAALTYAEDELSLKTAMKLIDRVIMFWLAIIALFTLEFWLG